MDTTTMMNISPQATETMELMKSVLIEDLPSIMKKYRNDSNDSPPPMAPVSDEYGGSDASSSSGDELYHVRNVSNRSTRIEHETENWTGSTSSAEKKKITWGRLEVRLHAIIPGDNPACEYGPAVSLVHVHVPFARML
jgi:hypothetical protein